MTKQLHIAAIVPYPIYPAKMGGQKGIALFYQYLNELAPVTIITAGGQQAENFKGEFLPVLGTSILRYINPALFSRIKKILSRSKSSHLVLEHPYFGWLAVLLKRTTSKPLIIHSHNIESLRFKSTGKWWWGILWNYEKFTHRNADINFFITDEDREYAVSNFKLSPSKCHTITYGFELSRYPAKEERIHARKRIEQLYNIREDEKILFFNGTLSYLPNLDAVDIILKQINPILKAAEKFSYRIIICGKGLPESYNDLKQWAGENIIYAGFVDDITVYFKATDIFINPLMDGGGIKTKLVEALGYNVNGVSTVSGAMGIPQGVTGKKLIVTQDGDWALFAQAILDTDITIDIDPAFFDHFYWGNIAKKAMEVIRDRS